MFDVQEIETGDLFAVKRIEMKGDINILINFIVINKFSLSSGQWKYNLSETKIMSQLNSDFVVQYYDSWIELDLNNSNELTKFVFIKMICVQKNSGKSLI